MLLITRTDDEKQLQNLEEIPRCLGEHGQPEHCRKAVSGIGQRRIPESADISPNLPQEMYQCMVEWFLASTQMAQNAPWYMLHGHSQPTTHSRRRRHTHWCLASNGYWYGREFALYTDLNTIHG
jgi:hypothetical protein